MESFDDVSSASVPGIDIDDLARLTGTSGFKEWLGGCVLLARELDQELEGCADAESVFFLAGDYESAANRAERAFAEMDNEFNELVALDARHRLLAAEVVAHNRLDVRLHELGEHFKLEGSVWSPQSTAQKHFRQILARRTDLEAQNRSVWKRSWELQSLRRTLTHWNINCLKAELAATEYRYLCERVVRVAAQKRWSWKESLGERWWARRRKLMAELERGEKEYRCLAVESFLYFPLRGNEKELVCIPLRDESALLNVQTRTGRVYGLNRHAGVARLEPYQRTVAATHDARLELFFAAAEFRALDAA